MINSNYDMHCIESSADKENNKMNENLTDMTGENKLLILNHEDSHFEPLIDPLTP